jgi:hypothetical protein
MGKKWDLVGLESEVEAGVVAKVAREGLDDVLLGLLGLLFENLCKLQSEYNILN